MLDQQVILLRWHGQFLLSLCGRGKDGKLWSMLTDQSPVRITPRQIIWETGFQINELQFAEWANKAQIVATNLDLNEIWQAVFSLESHLSLDQISALLWGDNYADYQLCGLLIHLHTTTTPYFNKTNRSFIPWTDEFLQEHLQKHAQGQLTERYYGEFLDWLRTGTAPRHWTEIHQQWLNYVWEYVVQGTTSPVAKSARNILQQLDPESRNYQKLSYNVLKERGLISEDQPLSLYRLSVKTQFSDNLELEANQLRNRTHFPHDDREDLTSLNVLSIDEADTMDLDDALSITHSDEGFSLGIHITDVSSIFPSDNILDREARERLTSLYLPEGIIPMLPHSLSQGVGSLLPGVIRPVVTILVKLDENFLFKGSDIFRATIKNRTKLSYRQAEIALQDSQHPLHEELDLLNRISLYLQKQRIALGAIEINRPEVKITVSSGSDISISEPQLPGVGRQLVAELMVLANQLLGQFLIDHEIPGIFRAQEPINLEGITDTSTEAVRRYQIVRKLRPTVLTTIPRPHALLAAPAYVQATSPLRRYLDLVIQRQITYYLQNASIFLDESSIGNLITEAERRLRDLGRLEEERKRYWIIKSMVERVGSSFNAVVLEKRDNYAIVELLDNLIRTSLYVGPTIDLGQTISILLHEIDLWGMDTKFTVDLSPFE